VKRGECFFSMRRFVLAALALVMFASGGQTARAQSDATITLNAKADGYRGIWYMNQPSKDEYVYKYSGGLGTYCAKHRPFAIYRPEVNKTFFCYGGAKKENSRQLLHMVSYFDHATKTVPRPTILLDKKTGDAHDNPVISIDQKGRIWIFSTSHGRSRPSYIHRSKRPYDVDEFELVQATREEKGQQKAIDNFSYFQVWHGASEQRGFFAFYTHYNDPVARTLFFMQSAEGERWSAPQRLAAIGEGHYQISGMGRAKLGTMFNYHPQGKGLNWRTNLYYLETADQGATWRTADAKPLSLPLVDSANDARVFDYEAEGLNVYIKDLRFDREDRPLLLYLTSKGYESGPKNDPRTWKVARWTGKEWTRSSITTSDNNYDMGELWLYADDDWRVIGPTEVGPQAFNPGGEIAMWQSRDQGASWSKMRQMTSGSEMNHTYVRRAIDGHEDFAAIWADGHGRKPSNSRIYIANAKGDVFRLPESMEGDSATPELVQNEP
jgi:hypothetical protein